MLKNGSTFQLCGFLMVIKGLPSTYNKDLQEDKVKMFETASTLLGILPVAAGAVETLKVSGSSTDEEICTFFSFFFLSQTCSADRFYRE